MIRSEVSVERFVQVADFAEEGFIVDFVLPQEFSQFGFELGIVS